MMEQLGDLELAGDNLTTTTVVKETPVHYATRYSSVRNVHTLLHESLSVLSWNLGHLVLPDLVQRCLLMWLVEGRSQEPEGEETVLVRPKGDGTAEALTELYMQWMVNVVYTEFPMSLMAIVTCAGYSHDELLLLLDLPLNHRVVGALSRQLDKFDSRGTGHVLQTQLHGELLATWSAMEATNVRLLKYLHFLLQMCNSLDDLRDELATLLVAEAL
ncbi:hypothetical protein KRP22_006763 [Phytophthora ramorum]|nr:hypothetical protein KRP22_2106 [Phytophthora ramorum]